MGLDGNRGIYMILNVRTGQYYIGSAQNLKRRFKEHLTKLNVGNHFNSRLQNAWNKYGVNEFKFLPVFFVEQKEHLIAVEQVFIDAYKAANREFGYNSRPMAGSNLGHKFGDEMRHRVRLANIGKRHSEDTKEKMSSARKGRTNSAVTRARISAAKIGKKRPDVAIWAVQKFSQFDKNEVRAIRADRSSGMTIRALASKYAANISTINNVVNGVGVAYAFE